MDYLLKSSCIIAIFYLSYRLFLQRETFFESNRWFLFIGLIVAALLPSVVIPIYIEYTPIQSPTLPITFTEVTSNNIETVEWSTIFTCIYILGVIGFALKLAIELSSLRRLIKNSPKKKLGRFSLIEIFESISPFSFFKWIVYNPKQFQKHEIPHIINHEKVHAKEYHTIDMLLAQLCCIIFWFNPFIWLYKKNLEQNLEFIADQKAQSVSENKSHYQRLLLKATVTHQPLAVTNNFYNSLIKKRIVMLQKSKSRKSNVWKYTLIIPALALFLMSFNTKEIYIEKHAENPAFLEQHFIVTANSSSNDLNAINQFFKNKPVKVKFTDVTRNPDQTISSLTINTKHTNGTDFTKRVTVSKSGGNETIKPFQLTFNPEADDIAFQLLEENETSKTVISKDKVTFEKTEPSPKTNKATRKPSESQDNKLGENPIYIVEGKAYKKQDLKGRALNTKGSIELIGKRESEKRFGKMGKDGAVVFNGRTTFENNISKTINKNIVITITKDFTEADLNLAKAQLGKEGLKVKFKGVKRNSNGEIIAIKIDASSSHAKANFNLNADKPINPINILFNKEDDKIAIGNSGINGKQRGVYTLKNFPSAQGAYVISGDNSFEYEFDQDTDHDVHFSNAKAYVLKSSDVGNQVLEFKSKDGNDEIIELKSKKYKLQKFPKKTHLVKIAKGDTLYFNGSKTSKIEWQDDDTEDVEFLIKDGEKGKMFFISTEKGEAPLIFLNDKEITKAEMNNLNSDKIDHVEVLKGSEALKRYGKKAKDGVILITTKD